MPRDTYHVKVSSMKWLIKSGISRSPDSILILQNWYYKIVNHVLVSLWIAQFDQIRILHANDPKLKVRKMWQLASKKALRKTEDERRPSWAQRFQHIEPLTAIRLRYNADKSIWVQDHIQVKIEARFLKHHSVEPSVDEVLKGNCNTRGYNFWSKKYVEEVITWIWSHVIINFSNLHFSILTVRSSNS